MSDRNSQFFDVADTIEIRRSQLPTQTFNHKTSFNMGELIPFYVNSDIGPGWTIKNTTAILCRMSTLKTPIMDNIYLDTYYFKVPIQWLDPNWKALMGENENGAWAVQTTYTTPKIIFTKTTNGTVLHNSILAYMGIPIGFGGQSTNTMKIIKYPVNAYCRIYNYWFRDQNAIAPIAYDTSSADLQFDSTSTITGGTLLKACKFRDYYTTALPQPQKSTPVSIPLGTSAPVFAGATNYTSTTGNPLRLVPTQSGVTMSNGLHNLMTYKTSGTSNLKVGFDDGTSTAAGNFKDLEPVNLYADLTKATAATINALRLAFATQQILEGDAIYGTMYQNVIRGHFGVVASTESLHIPEYLGGKRVPLSAETIVNTAESSGNALGNVGGYSITFDVNEDFTKSFTEHCVLIGILVVRQNHTYQQGINRMWTRSERLDYYFPEMAHIGNQPIYNYELYAQGNSTDNQVYGYKEAWAEYKYQPSRISGMLSSNYSAPLDSWHLGDDYSSLPVYGQQFLEETNVYLDRCLDVTSAVADQFIADIEITQEITAPMPVHCTPGMHVL